jgi:hypothetical protein
MITLFLYLSLASYLTICHSPAHAAQDGGQPQIAKPGDAATGEVLMEKDGRLQLNAKPCDKNKVVVIFRAPYIKEMAGTINCEGDVKKLVHVVQK